MLKVVETKGLDERLFKQPCWTSATSQHKKSSHHDKFVSSKANNRNLTTSLSLSLISEPQVLALYCNKIFAVLLGIVRFTFHIGFAFSACTCIFSRHFSSWCCDLINATWFICLLQYLLVLQASFLSHLSTSFCNFSLFSSCDL